MKQRGRKSQAALSVVKEATVQRPEPPAALLPPEKELWNAITGSRAPDFFDQATIPLLTEYCRLKTQVEMLAEQLNAFEPEWLEDDDGLRRYKTITDVRDKAEGRMIALARSMRLTQQARYVPDKAKNRPTGGKARKPWERA